MPTGSNTTKLSNCPCLPRIAGPGPNAVERPPPGALPLDRTRIESLKPQKPKAANHPRGRTIRPGHGPLARPRLHDRKEHYSEAEQVTRTLIDQFDPRADRINGMKALLSARAEWMNDAEEPEWRTWWRSVTDEDLPEKEIM